MAVSAPGVDIISTYNGSTLDYEYDSGTSMATPFVTGLSAYTLAFAPSLLPDQLKTVLMESADSIDGSSYTSVSSSYGAGRVNVYNTVYTAATSPPTSGLVYCTEPITITVYVDTTATADIPVYLYDSSGKFVEVGYTGDSTGYSANSTKVVPDSAGQVSFYLLKPDTYTATAINGSSSASATKLTISTSSSAAVTATIAF
jgi:thermitase